MSQTEVTNENGNGEKPLNQFELREFRELKEEWQNFLDNYKKKQEFRQQLKGMFTETLRWSGYMIAGLFALTHVFTSGFSLEAILKAIRTFGGP